MAWDEGLEREDRDRQQEVKGHMKKVYVASSWRNIHHPGVVAEIRAAGIPTYDFRHPGPSYGFSWKECAADGEDWQKWTMREYIAALQHPRAVEGFSVDMCAMRNASAVVLVQPCGRSSHLELGWAAGRGIPTCILLQEGEEAELMNKMVDKLACTIDEVVTWLTTECSNTLPLKG